ncbi:MAG: hypothetical protein JW997_04850 [Actinobacteria bacterium]|nr:hypothetical protein [Actinomycetota bacterium]
MANINKQLEKVIHGSNGVLKLKPAWVARDFLPPGKRLGLKDEEYNVGKRGFISERWLASVTKADNAVGPEDEGLSYIDTASDSEITLKDAVSLLPEAILGSKYSKNHKGLGRLVKIYDFASRIPFHIHQMEKDARLVGHNSKDEAYYFLDDAPIGPHPETFFGVHPYISEQKKYDILLPYLTEWKDDLILKHSRAYLNVPGEGFFLPSGVLHAPGTALTLELQEDSDVFAMLQALNAGKIISKDLLFKDVRKADREKYGEKIILEQIDWEVCGDPYFYENHHLESIPIKNNTQDGAQEYWIYYNTSKFSGKKLIIKPGKSFISKENGVFNIFVWRGKGKFEDIDLEAGNFGFDELLITHDRAIENHTIKNTGSTDMMIFKFFGPDINTEVPMIKKIYK